MQRIISSKVGVTKSENALLLTSLGNKRIYIPTLIYGVEAATTTFACLVELFYLDVPQSDLNKLVGFYLPTLVIPLVLAVDMTCRISDWIPTEKDVKVKAL